MKRSIMLLAAVVTTLCVQAQTVDRIVAVVDNDVILQSELSAQVQFFVLNNRVDPKAPGLREQVLQSMVNEKLIVAKAIEDSVTVTDDEVQQQLEAVIQQRIQQVGSEARLEEMYGMPLSRIKREYRDEMRRNLLSQKVQQQRFGTAQIGRYEVEQFYQQYRDSLPPVPEELDLSRIFIKPKVSNEARAAGQTYMEQLLDSLKAGVPFEDLARRHSQDPGSAQQGGDLGFVRRGQFVKEFETAVFALGEGQISGIVETDFGLHVIQLVERRGDAVHARHVLRRFERTQASDDAAIALLDSLRARALAGENFAELAKKYSEDKETNLIGGSLGTVELEQLDKTMYPAVVSLKPEEISPPVRWPVGNTYGYQIILVRKRTPAHTMTIDQDYRKLETIALNFKRNKDYQAWIEELKGKIYWQVRLDESAGHDKQTD
jgi:peptidyl-prolyl cis-trans isomerase SurA